MADDQPYDDGDYAEEQRLPTIDPEQFYFLIRHKASRNMFRVLAKDRIELADKVSVGDWEPDPNNTRDPDEEEDD
jgi:hypothetical protein